MIPFNLTPSAITHICDQIDKVNNAVGFYLSVKKTGCSGFAWKPEIVVSTPADAEKFELDNNLVVFIGKSAKDFITGITIDYCDDNTGLKQKRLVFINPNETGKCGCGESFTMD